MKFTNLIKKLPLPIFSKQDLRLLSANVFDYQLTLWQKQGNIIKVKNGLYVLSEAASQILPEELSDRIYSPSYVSMEKAMVGYGFIPAKGGEITCLSTKTTRRFKNHFGEYSYRHIQPELFFGYWEVKGRNYHYLSADPEKALLDYLYFNLAKLKSEEDLKKVQFDHWIIKDVVSKEKLKKYLSFYLEKDKIHSICKKLIGEF